MFFHPALYRDLKLTSSTNLGEIALDGQITPDVGFRSLGQCIGMLTSHISRILSRILRRIYIKLVCMNMRVLSDRVMLTSGHLFRRCRCEHMSVDVKQVLHLFTSSMFVQARGGSLLVKRTLGARVNLLHAYV